MGGSYNYRQTREATAPPEPTATAPAAAVNPKASILKVFAAFDHSRTGRVAVEDFKRGLHYLGVSKHHTPAVRTWWQRLKFVVPNNLGGLTTRQEVDSWISRVDSSGEGVVEYATAIDKLTVNPRRQASRNVASDAEPAPATQPGFGQPGVAKPTASRQSNVSSARSAAPADEVRVAWEPAAGQFARRPNDSLFPGGRTHTHHPGSLPEPQPAVPVQASPSGDRQPSKLTLVPPTSVVGVDAPSDREEHDGSYTQRAPSGPTSVSSGYTGRSRRSTSSRILAAGPFATNQHDEPALSEAAHGYMSSLVRIIESPSVCSSPDPCTRLQALQETLDAHAQAAIRRVSEQCASGRMQKTFRSLDRSGRGELGPRAFKQGLALLGLDEQRDDFDTILRLADPRGTGRVRYVRCGGWFACRVTRR